MAACHWLLSAFFAFAVSIENDDITKSINDPTSLDKHDDPNELIQKKLETLHAQVLELQTRLSTQQTVINDLNDTLQTFVFTSDEYGVIYDKTDDRPLLLTSLHAHDVPFVMLNVMSVRLPKRDAHGKKKRKRKKKQSKRGLGSRSTSRQRFVHVIITLSRDGIFQLWDDEQNELHTYFDATILPKDSTEDELIDSNQNFMVYSDIVRQNKFGNTWFVMARNDANFIKLYAVAAWRDHVDDKVNRKIRKSVISGQITPENTIYRPSDTELDKLKAEQAKRRKNAPYRRSAAKRTKMHKKKEEDVNEFDVDVTTTSTNEDTQCHEPGMENDAQCKETEAGEAVEEPKKEKEQAEDTTPVIEVKNATVTGVTVYQQQKRKYIIVSYSDGKVFSFKPSGVLASSASTIPYTAPNKTIVAIATTRKKYEMLVVTEVGFQFLKLPKLSKTGPFCHLPVDTTVNAIEFDVTMSTLMYLGTTDGRLLVYNTRKLNRKMCKSLDTFTIHPDAPLQIETLPGYLLITSSLGLHVYNVSKKKTAPYQRPGLVLVRKFEDEFGDNDQRLASSNVLVSSYTDPQQRTVIAYVQSAGNVSMDSSEGDKDVSYRFVVMESYLPSFNAQADRGGVLGIISKAPIFVGIAMFAFFWVFFKGKGGSGSFSNSPLGRLGKIFGGRSKRRNSLARGGSRDVYGKKERWNQRHGGAARPGGGKMSANMRYGNQTSSRKTPGKPGGFRTSGASYKRGGLGGGDWSD
eukprot:54343_1